MHSNDGQIQVSWSCAGAVDEELNHRVCYLTPLPAGHLLVGVMLRVEQMIAALRTIESIDLHVWRPQAVGGPRSHAQRNPFVATGADLAVAGLALTTAYLPRNFQPATKDAIVRWLRGLQPDLVLITHPTFTALIPDLVGEGFDVVVDAYNVEQRIGRQFMRVAENLQQYAHALCRYAVARRKERTLLPLARAVWAVSDNDVAELGRLVRGRAPVRLVPNVVDVGRYAPAHDPEPYALGFFGSLDFSANELAAKELVRTILPALRETVPGARLYLVGANPSEGLRELAAGLPHVVVTGTVDDTRPWMARCAVLLAPLLHGSGTRLKILEALAMAKPMVSTPQGCEGLDVRDGVHLLIRDIASFPDAIASLLSDPESARAMGQRGRALVAENYSVTSLRAILKERLAECLDAGVL